MCPDAEINLVPVERSIPIFAYSVPEFNTIHGTEEIDSTLLTTVGFCHNPLTAGKGGFKRGFPRLPSNDSIKAVSSPHIYAPAPQ